MDFHKVDSIPNGRMGMRYKTTKLYGKLTEFMDLKTKMVHVTSWEQNYKNVRSA